MDYCNTEVWKSVVGFEGFYEVSNLGNVRSLDRFAANNRGSYVIPGRVLKPSIDRTGYKFVVLTGEKQKKKNLRIHRVVALSFIENKENKPFVNHIDGDKLNNNANNLEWCTPQENTDHAIKAGLFVPKKMCGPASRIKTIGMFSLEGELLRKFSSSSEAAEFVGTDNRTIIKVCNKYRSYKTAKGYKWEYI